MTITVRLHPLLQKLAGGCEAVEVTGRTTGECLEQVEGHFPDVRRLIRDKRGQLRRYCEILVNSESANTGGLGTLVRDGDQIDIVVLITGG
ncbi:MAG: MoaD/ThiS family protein [Dehalococcoidia bacterium]